jgi:hypothetical protein
VGAEENIWAEEKEVTGGWRKVNKEELRILYAPSVVRIIKSRMVGLGGHVALLVLPQ